MPLVGTLVRLIAEAAIYRGVAGWVAGETGWRRRLGTVAAGLAWLAVAALVGAWAIVAAVSTIFFQLAELPRFVGPALLMAGVLFLMACLAALAAWRAFRRA
jgi:hypothetical protein